MGLIVIESTTVAYAGRRCLADWKAGHLHRMTDVIVSERNELLESDGAVYSRQALTALGRALDAGARLTVWTPQHEGDARRFFLYRGIPLIQDTWRQFTEKNPGAAYLTTAVLKHSAARDIHPRFTRLPQLGLTPLHIADALDLLNIRRPA